MEKTKAELELEVKELELEVKELRNQIEKAQRKETYSKVARETKAVFDAFVEAGFTEEQAWEMIVLQIRGGVR